MQIILYTCISNQDKTLHSFQEQLEIKAMYYPDLKRNRTPEPLSRLQNCLC